MECSTRGSTPPRRTSAGLSQSYFGRREADPKETSLLVDLGQGLSRFPTAPTKTSVFSAIENDPVIAELHFEDRSLKKSILKTYSAVYEPSLTRETFPMEQKNGHTVHVRAPAIYIPHFDNFVREAMWGSTCTSSDEENLLREGQTQFSTAELFTGYFYLLRNLDSTWIANPAYLADSLSREVAAELVYFLAFRLGLLYSQLLSQWQSLSADISLGRHQAIAFYGLEVVYRIMRSVGTICWKIPSRHPLQPLSRLETDFRQASSDVLDRILAYECYLSANVRGANRTRSLPKVVEFARAEGKKAFPSHLAVTAYKHGLLTQSFNAFPLMHLGHEKYSIIDVLTKSEEGLTSDILSGSVNPRTRFPEYWVTEDNSKVIYRLPTLQYDTHTESMDTISSTCGSTVRSKQEFPICELPSAPAGSVRSFASVPELMNLSS
ncbi:uncharacterized protein Z518_06404 [Rhinocladiella mackenziei CBS 650.93]|uniref:Uncharacterized protein n=1 Tax=Rhinocladiella mackenziei CBS 650.93 TaxID=1442369 RepID=A0A0D2FTX8_9EURO|nr:uncharacterized protein Z518_06404 [Rhinocladiella mackenziei CBS 650.93]KIX05532.1 hypothetical protein Z518_06404 [Rhinocladiella mackenziei CBS 650.93]